MFLRLLVITVLASPPPQEMTALDREIEGGVMGGWATARALALEGGGSADTVAMLTASLRRIDGWLADAERGTTPRDAVRALELRYADAAIHAAADAAQDERDEMAVYLAHARDLSRRIELLGGMARWPLPIDEVEGELWLEVDRYAEARDAYRRATALTGSVRAWLGLGRASDRLGDISAACAAFRKVLSAAPTEAQRSEADRYLWSPDCRLPSPDRRDRLPTAHLPSPDAAPAASRHP